MKKTLVLLSSLLLLLAGCSNHELENVDPQSGENTSSEKIRWYGVKSIENDGTKGVADGAKRWNQDAGIFVKFINPQNSGRSIDEIKQIAHEWEQHAGIKFNFVDTDKKADVRIAFDWNGNDWLTWSYTGTDAKFERSQNEPTAVLAGLQYLSDEEFRGDVLRLFGQILGMEYEQRHQEWSKNGYWRNETQLQNYWENQFDGYNMDWEEIREYVFAPLTSESAIQLIETKEIDELSIMAWPYYNRQQTTKLLANFELSEGDKTFIAQLYPKNNVSLPTIQEAWVDAGFFVWTDGTKTALQITELGQQQEYLPDVSDGEQLTTVNKLFQFSRIRTMPLFNTSNVTDFGWMFWACNFLTEIPDFDTSNGTDFNGMFAYCSSLINFPNIDTSKGTNFNSMFAYCDSMRDIPHIDTSKGTDFGGMFYGNPELCSISDFDTSKGTDFGGMFGKCLSLTNVPNLNTSNGTDFSGMFASCESLTSIPELNTLNGTNFNSMFMYCNSLVNAPYINTSNGTDFSHMYEGCQKLISIPLLDTSNGTDFNCMFAKSPSITNIPHFDTSKGIDFSTMFAHCNSLTSVPDFDTSKGRNFGFMFYYSGLTTKPNLDLSQATDIDRMYEGTPFE
ncbi:MAG: BspA family leucine-rich repeat surface protein [Dysgonomonas sp.]